MDLRSISKFHLESFNYAVHHGLENAVKNIDPVHVNDSNGITVTLKDAIIEKKSNAVKEEVKICKSGKACSSRKQIEFPVFPSECRMREETYCADLKLTFLWKQGVTELCETTRSFPVPIMVKSELCLLSGLDDEELIQKGEEELDCGGYFIINGKERVLRMHLVQRRNYPLAVIKEYWKKKGKNFSEYGIQIRSVQSDERNVENTLHFLTDGYAVLSFKYPRVTNLSLMLVLKSLINETDRYIYIKILENNKNNKFLDRCVLKMMRDLQDNDILTHHQAKCVIGEKFCSVLHMNDPIQAADYILKHCILIHLKTYEDKFKFLCYMTRKLFALVKGYCKKEDPDNLVNQEVLLSGNLYLMALKLDLSECLQSVKRCAERRLSTNVPTEGIMKRCTTLAKINSRVNVLLSTGNIPYQKMGLLQETGYSVVCQKINALSWIANFTCIRKQVTENALVASTTIRKFFPECWGYICPVHTPDGEQTGITNHLSSGCEVATNSEPSQNLEEILIHLGLLPHSVSFPYYKEQLYEVFLNGEIIGHVSYRRADDFVQSFRDFRSTAHPFIPSHAEIYFVSSASSFFTGIFIYTTVGRLMRQVKNVNTNKAELIGCLEEMNFQIRLKDSRNSSSKVQYEELKNNGILSVIANTLPYSDLNQSPRNIYACHMGKQAVGFASYAMPKRADVKLHHLIYPQSPLIYTESFNNFDVKSYPHGINAVVAVVSYSGYDMEDAIILNKSSVERGMFSSYLFHTVSFDLKEKAKELNLHNARALKFEGPPSGSDFNEILDTDGLPFVGVILTHGDPVCSYVETLSGEMHYEPYSSMEDAVIQDVKLLGSNKSPLYLTKISITMRILRVPEVGDKFASRHGQKGVCSRLWAEEDMPFTEDGTKPDILFNPNGFPSRMTIGMMIEFMAGKFAALKHSEEKVKCDPFAFTEDDSPFNYISQKLEGVGFNRYGTEKMYSGISGEELQASIFHGIVYYQRLKHMVKDKYQVGSKSKIHHITRQPIKGHSREAAIRFGEMERDSLIAHGTSVLLHDRFMTCSDACTAYLCTSCHELLYPILEQEKICYVPDTSILFNQTCRVCESMSSIVKIRVPYVFIYLAAELSSVNIKVKLIEK